MSRFWSSLRPPESPQDAAPERDSVVSDAPPDSAVGSSLFKSHLGLRVHVSVRRAPRTPSVHTHVLCLLGITTRGNPTLTNSDAGDYELLFINTVSSFLVFTFAKKHFVLTKYSPVDESCPDEGEQAWPDCCPSGGRWPLLPIMAGIPTLPPTSLFFCPWSRQMICISCGMGSRQEAVTGVGGSLPGRSAPPGEPQPGLPWDGPPTSLPQKLSDDFLCSKR